jgi:hypothetical protein
MGARAVLDLDRDVAEAGEPGKPGLVGGGRLGPVRHKRHHGGVVAGADAPDGELGDAVAAVGFEPVGDFVGQVAGG